MENLGVSWAVIEPVPVPEVFVTSISSLAVDEDEIVHVEFCTRQHIAGTSEFALVVGVRLGLPLRKAIEVFGQACDMLARSRALMS